MEPTHVSDTWERGDPYERYIGRWSRLVAPRFLAWLNPPAGQRWLEVGFGTGALSAAIADHASPALLTGIEPSRGFLTTARRNLAGRALLFQGTAAAIALQDAAVNVVVSGLVLNFLPDPIAALREVARVTRPGGIVAAYVWDYAGKMELIRYFWDAAVALRPAATALDEGVRFPICHPEALRQRFAAAGLRNVEHTAIDIPTRFASFDDYWQPFLGGQGPAPAYAMSLGDSERARLRDALHARLPQQADGAIALIARAWAVRAIIA